DPREERVRRLTDELHCRAGTGRPLDADRGALAERNLKSEFAGQRRPDDLLLHFAVERDKQLGPAVVLPQVDQRVLLGELCRARDQRPLAAGAGGNHDRPERGWREVALRELAVRLAECVPDPDCGEPLEHADLPGRDLLAPARPAALEYADRRDLRLL